MLLVHNFRLGAFIDAHPSMPRQARLDATEALHHIMVRGINRAVIFADSRDREQFLDRLGETVAAGRCLVIPLGSDGQPSSSAF